MKLSLNCVQKAFVLAVAAISLSLPLTNISEAAPSGHNNASRPVAEKRQESVNTQKKQNQNKPNVTAPNQNKPNVTTHNQNKPNLANHKPNDHREPAPSHHRMEMEKRDAWGCRSIPKHHEICRKHSHAKWGMHFHCSKSYHRHANAHHL